MRILFRSILVTVLVLAMASVAFAAFTGPYTDNYVIENNAGVFPATPNLSIQDSTGACTDTHVSYLQFSAAGIGTVDTASLTFTVGGTPAGLNNSPTLTLYGVADYDPATLSGTNNPTPTDAIQSMTIPSTTVAGSQFTFGGADLGLESYIQSQADTDDVVSLALSFSANCFSVNSSMSFYSQEGGSAAQDPALVITGTNPNAVNMSGASAERVSWPLYAGLGALGVILGIGMAVTRRKMA